MVCIPVLIAAWLWLTFPKTASLREPRGANAADLAALWSGVGGLHGDPPSGHQAGRPPAPNIFIQLLHSAIFGRRPIRSGGISGTWRCPGAWRWSTRRWSIDHPTLRNFYLPAAGLAALSLAAWWLWRRQQRSAVAAFLGFWFVINLAPPVVVAPMVLQHDRYLYLSGYAFCALLAWAILNLGRLPNRGAAGSGLVRGGSLVGSYLA